MVSGDGSLLSSSSALTLHRIIHTGDLGTPINAYRLTNDCFSGCSAVHQEKLEKEVSP
jgi:hypothetical protein